MQRVYTSSPKLLHQTLKCNGRYAIRGATTDMYDLSIIVVSWIMLLSLLLSKDSILYWLYHFPCQVETSFIPVSLEIICLEAQEQKKARF